jgi:hypothetical protein
MLIPPSTTAHNGGPPASPGNSITLELSPRHSPALTHRSNPSLHTLDIDLSLPTAIANLIQHLVQPLTKLYTPKDISALRLRLTSALSEAYAPSWDPQHPQHGSGTRSLICNRQMGLPKLLREAAAEVGIPGQVWVRALARKSEMDLEGRTKGDEWEAWCDPGTVVWRYGGWEWEDVGYEQTKLIRGELGCSVKSKPGASLISSENYQIIWQSAASPRPAPPTTTTSEAPANTTPARPSYAIPIRAPVALPAVFAVPPTPAAPGDISVVPNQPQATSPLLPAASISRAASPSHSETSSGYESNASNASNAEEGHSRASTNATSVASIGHKGSHSMSSTASSQSAQLLSPASRPPSADPFISDRSRKSPTPTGPQRGRTPVPDTRRETSTGTPVTSSTPTVTPYDGGNVTVMGGGVKLGGARPSSAMSTRSHYDRSRSPSVSLASRALGSATGPNNQPGQRKTRTRRRIMPTYLGHLGQPGVGGPVPGAFGQFAPAIQPGGWQGVGVGMGPPPVPGMGRPLTQLRVSSI